MDVDKKKFISTYKKCKKDIRLIKSLLSNNLYRTKWCKKRGLNYLSDEQLEIDLKKQQELLENMKIYLVWK